jgi:hypothetical protein
MRITVIDAFGNKHRVEIDTYVYEYPVKNNLTPGWCDENNCY